MTTEKVFDKNKASLMTFSELELGKTYGVICRFTGHNQTLNSRMFFLCAHKA